jgi:ferrous iron transport protein A
MSEASAKSLGDLEVGDSAIVENVRCARSTAVRLMEMGLCRGTRVEVLRRAPLGDPIELFVSGYSLSIRRAEAAGVSVTDVVSARASAKTKAAPLLVRATR